MLAGAAIMDEATRTTSVSLSRCNCFIEDELFTRFLVHTLDSLS